jgi:signal transduction histidine kinase/CheY-like chemotaxis protein
MQRDLDVLTKAHGAEAYFRAGPNELQGPIRCVTMFHIPSGVAFDEPACVCLASTEQTLANHLGDENVSVESLRQSLPHLADALDAVRLRRDLLRERDSLQEAVRAATAELRQAVTVAEDARAEAIRAAKARSEFLANMSHEIRTPMTAILGYAELLVDRGVEEQTRLRYALTITQAGRHLLQILDDVLNLARIESGKLRAEPTLSHPAQLLLDVHSLMNVRAQERGIQLSVEFVSPLPDRALVDGERLRQVLLNLVGNGLKFTDRGEVALRASVDGDRLRIVVADTGVGIPQHMLGTIFESFEQVNTRSRKAGGAGLGLAITRGLVSLLGGDITVSSQLGKGSEFTLTVPFQPVDDAVWIASPQMLTRSHRPARIQRFRGKVLVVDDTPVNRAMLKALLERSGLVVQTAADGVRAVVLVRQAHDGGAPFDLVFMDMQMPIMSGYEAASTLRVLYPKLPIVALTAHAMAGDKEDCLSAGCTDYLAKPVSREELYAKVAAYVETDATGVEEPEPPLASVPVPSGRISEQDIGVPRAKSAFANDEIIRPLLPEFAADARASFTRLAQAVVSGERKVAKSLAHRMKGNAASFGFPDLATAAGDLELLCGDTQASDPDLRAALSVVAAHLAAMEIPLVQEL